MRFHELAASIILALYAGRQSSGLFRQHTALAVAPWFTDAREWWE